MVGQVDAVVSLPPIFCIDSNQLFAEWHRVQETVRVFL
jgi:hypothetical protein